MSSKSFVKVDENSWVNKSSIKSFNVTKLTDSFRVCLGISSGLSLNGKWYGHGAGSLSSDTQVYEKCITFDSQEKVDKFVKEELLN